MDDEDLSPASGRVAAMSRAQKERIALGGSLADVGSTTFVYTDGGSGIRDAPGATAFPSPLALAASFDESLARRYGEALADEARAAGRNVVLGAVLDVARVPWDGRTGEGLGEDPELAARIGGAIIEGVQSRHVLSVAKHVVANNAEIGRTGDGPFGRRSPAIDAEVDEQTLHEVYLKPFRRIVERHGVGGLMGSYNQLNGQYACENAELWRTIRGEWGFRGVTVPDYLFAIRDDEAALRAGMDLPGLDDMHGRTPEMVAGLTDDALDDLVEHVVGAARAVDLAPAADPQPAHLGTALALQLAEEIATAGTVLLANDGVVPAAPGTRVALFAPASLDHLLTIGGSAAVDVVDGRSPRLADALRDLGVTVDEVEIRAADTPPPPQASDDLESTRASIRQLDGPPRERELAAFSLHDREVDADEWTAEASGSWTAPTTGAYRVTATFAGRLELLIDGQLRARGFREASPMLAGPEYPMHTVIDVTEGDVVDIGVGYETGPAISVPGTPIGPGFRVGVHPLDDPASLRARADAADVAVIVLGRASGEAMDVGSLDLPEDQRRALDAIADGPTPVVVVTMGSGPLAMPWRDRANAIVHAWQGGERAGAALATLLVGESEPTGRLPLSFPSEERDVPLAPESYPGVDGRAAYLEGHAVGYRGYEERGVDPAFAFGHGLGYTTFELGDPTFHADGTDITVSADLTNTGARRGSTVAQLYARRPGDSHHQLVGFAKATVDAGATERIRIAASLADLAARRDGRWTVLGGDYELSLGFSSVDRRRTGSVVIG